jgi:hypothetical protein
VELPEPDAGGVPEPADGGRSCGDDAMGGRSNLTDSGPPILYDASAERQDLDRGTADDPGELEGRAPGGTALAFRPTGG